MARKAGQGEEEEVAGREEASPPGREEASLQGREDVELPILALRTFALPQEVTNQILPQQREEEESPRTKPNICGSATSFSQHRVKPHRQFRLYIALYGHKLAPTGEGRTQLFTVKETFQKLFLSVLFFSVRRIPQ
ncbi:hypothetical protein STEG23_011027 [Scotinomys teguina]